MEFTVQKLSIPEFDQLEQQIIDNDKNLDQMHESWKILDDFFSRNYYENDSYWRNTYFRIYVRLTWKKIGSFDTEKFVEIIRRQTPMVLLLDVDVLKEIMWYLGLNSADEKQAVSLYQKLKENFLQSEAVVGVWQSKNVTVAELVKEIDSVYKSGDSLAVADFESRLRQIMFPDEVSKKYFTADPEQAKERFLDLVSFFQTFTQENIWYVVDAFLNPEKYQNVPAGQAPPTTPPAAPITATLKPAPAVKSSTPSAPAPKPATPPQPAKQTSPAKPTLQQIKSQIESQFKKDAEGNFADIEGVMAKLNELADKNNDPKIAEMIYFDEKDNKFKWNI